MGALRHFQITTLNILTETNEILQEREWDTRAHTCILLFPICLHTHIRCKNKLIPIKSRPKSRLSFKWKTKNYIIYIIIYIPLFWNDIIFKHECVWMPVVPSHPLLFFWAIVLRLLDSKHHILIAFDYYKSMK